MSMNEILTGDCLEHLKRMPDNSIDSCVTDPPYGLSKEPNITEVLSKWLAGEPYDHGHSGFMGKAWDSFVPHPDIWKEIYRVLKPGAHALVFAGTRTQDLMTISLRLAGFEVRDVIEWLYFSGFPKSMDVGKAFDRRRTEDAEPIIAVAKFLDDRRRELGLTRKGLAERFGVVNEPIQTYTTPKDDGRIDKKCPTWEHWLKLKGIMDFSDEMDEEVWRLNGRKGKPGDAWGEREKVGEKSYVVGVESTWGQNAGGRFKIGEHSFDITAPATPLARKWDGWETALKPAHEPIIVVRKPLIGTVADNVEKYGTGGINIDGCRIALGGGEKQPIGSGNRKWLINGEDGFRNSEPTITEKRFPANIVTVEPDAFYSKYCNVTPEELCKKASKRDRNSDWTGQEKTTSNNHPTVKPSDLMAWLVRLVTPKNGVVIDPFAGSGSTLVAAKREGFSYIGVEQSSEYVEICNARLEPKGDGETCLQTYLF